MAALMTGVISKYYHSNVYICRFPFLANQIFTDGEEGVQPIIE